MTLSPKKKGLWRTREAYDCAMVPCGEEAEYPGPMVVTVLRKTNWCVNVGGSASASALVSGKSGLLMRLLGELGVSVTIQVGFSYCDERGEGVSVNVSPKRCWHVAGRWVHRDMSVTGSVTEAETVGYWECVKPSGMIVTVSTMYGVATSTGWADRIAEEVFQQARRSPGCSGPPIDPEHDGKFEEPCCRPMPACDPDTEDPCCGCFGVN